MISRYAAVLQHTIKSLAGSRRRRAAAKAARGTRSAGVPCKPAPADLEPRHSVPLGE